MTQKKTGFILITALLVLTFTLSACEQEYAPVEEMESLATQVMEGGFAATAESMLDIEQFGTQTAIANGAPAAEAAETAVPEVVDETSDAADEVEVIPETEEATDEAETPDVAPATDIPASTATPVVVSPAATDAPIATSGTYILKPGEHPYCIARRFNVNPDELLAASGLSASQGSVYYANLVLKIPQTGNTFPGDRVLNAHTSTYTAQSNTTVYGVACYFGDIDPQDIIALNSNLVAPYNVAAGTTLNIP